MSKTVALVLAYETDDSPLSVDPEEGQDKPVECGKPETGPAAWPLQLYKGKALVCHALDAAAEQGCAAVTVLVAADTADAVRAALEAGCAESAMRDAAVPPVSYEVFDAEREATEKRASNYFELYGYSKYVFDIAAKACADAQADAAFVLSGSQPRISATHLAGLQSGWDELPGMDIAVSWHSGMRRLPFLVPGTFLASLESSGLCRPSEVTGFRPAPHLKVYELDFRGKKVMARPAPSAARKTFLDELSISALRAVRISKLEGEKREKALKELNDADRKLVSIADGIVGRMAPEDANDRGALARADALGHRCKLDFPLFNAEEYRDSLVYLDISATAQRLGCALQAQYEFDTHANANVYRSIYKLSKKATAALGRARSQVEGFIGAEPRSVAFTANSTAACNLAATAWGERNVRRGDVIVTWVAEHHSNMLPWVMLAERTGARVVMLPLDDGGRIDQDAYDEALKLKPAIVCCAHVSNTMGIVNPAADMARKAHQAGAKFFLDASQSAPHVPLNVQELGVDFLAFTGHKIYGPMGIGCLYTGKDVRGDMRPLGAGGGTVSHVSEFSYELLPAPFRFEQGTPPVSEAVGLARALEYLQVIGMDEVAAHDAALTAHLMRGMRLVDGVTVFGDHAHEDGQAGLVSLTLAGTDATGLVRSLDKCDVAIRGGGHCALALSSALGIIGTGRFSFGIYNTAEDAEAAVVAVEACRQSLR